MFEGNEYGKVEGRSLVDILQVKVGSEVGPCDEISYGRDVGKMEG